MWGKYWIVRGIVDSVSRGGGGRGGLEDDGDGCGCLIAVLCVAAVLSILVYVVVPVAIVVGCVFLLYLFIKKLLTSASFRRFVWRVLLCFFVVGCVIGIARGVAYIFF